MDASFHGLQADMKRLRATVQQQKVLDCVRGYAAECGFPPTRAEISEMLGFRSPNAAEAHLRALQKKGLIQIDRGTARGLRVIGSFDDPLADHVLMAAELGLL